MSQEDTMTVTGDTGNNGIHWGGGSGQGNNGGQNGHSGSNVTLAFGLPAVVGPATGELGFALSGEAVSAAVTEALALLKGPLKLGLWGVALYGILPGEIAKDDPRMMSRIVRSLPSDLITTTPINALPFQAATVSVKNRVVDVIQNKRQHLAIVAGRPMSIPVVNAKQTGKASEFSASLPGLPDVHITISKTSTTVVSPSRGLTQEKANIQNAGFTPGESSIDAVVRFPQRSGHKPVYVSVTNVLTPEQVIKRQEEENLHQKVWDANHPVEVAERVYLAAKAELNAENKNIKSLQSALSKAQNSPENRTLTYPNSNPYIQKYTGSYGEAREAYVENKMELDIILGDDGAAALATYIMVKDGWFSGLMVTDTVTANHFHRNIGLLNAATRKIRDNLLRIRTEIDENTKRLLIAAERRKRKKLRMLKINFRRRKRNLGSGQKNMGMTIILHLRQRK